MWRAFPRAPMCLAAGCLVALACSHEPRERARTALPPAPARSDAFVGPARFLPDVTSTSTGLVDVLPDGSRRLIVSGIRVVDHPDGAIERAREVLPAGAAKVVPLPSRMGGGLLVYIVSSTGTQVWRAKSWLANLEPLAEAWGAVDDISAGFDRLYVRTTTGDVRAIDPDSGGQLTLGPLPPATRIRALAFADAWRAVAIVDFRGALATFDAGNTWRTV